MKALWIFALPVAVGLGFWLKFRIQRSRRRTWRVIPVPDQWIQWMTEDWPVYEKLPEQVKTRLHRHMQVFLHEKNMEGCGGLELTEHMQVLIAAQACLLLSGGDHEKVFPILRSILVYPHTFVSGKKGIFGGPEDDTSARLGESWSTGTVVLSWHSVQGGAANIFDGHNVTLHEFAHQLDQEDGQADGAPILETRTAARTWASCFQHEYTDFLDQLERGHRTVIDEYGATNGAEFFATATEAFFEKPRQLHENRPELHHELKEYYKLDPLTWFSS